MDYLAGILLTLVLVRLAWIDLRTFRLPDLWTLPLIAVGLGLALLGFGPSPLASAVGGLVGFGLFWAIGTFYHARTGNDGLGLGDAKLFAAAGTWVGFALLPHVLLVAALGGLAYALLTRQRTGPAIAFGPWIALGFWLVWVIFVADIVPVSV